MKKVFAALIVFTLLCCGCARTPAQEDESIHILTTTYPLYLFTTAMTDGMDPGVTVDLLVNEQTSCLHDYTLTVTNMKAIERADIIIMNGVGFEAFMDDALSYSHAFVIDCSQNIPLLPAAGHHDHDHGEAHDHGHFDPHIWLSTENAVQMCANIAAGLSQFNESWITLCKENLTGAEAAIGSLSVHQKALAALSRNNLITFHDGFAYFAASGNLPLLKAIEEEEGSEASAAVIKEITALIREYDISAIFTEKNGSDSTALAIARETGVAVYQLDMIMSGTGTGLQPYLDAMTANYETIFQALGG